MLEEVEHFFKCPYCFERISMLLDCSSEKQEYIEDCEVCCQAININFEIGNGRIHIFSCPSRKLIAAECIHFLHQNPPGFISRIVIKSVGTVCMSN